MEHRADDDGQLALPLDLPGPAAPRERRRRHLPVYATVRVTVAAALGLVLASVALLVVPYRTTVAGVEMTVTASVLPERRGLSVDSSLGSLAFREVTPLPLGLHGAPTVDLATVRAVTAGGDAFAQTARDDLRDRLPGLAVHLLAAALLGLALGVLTGLLLVDGARAAFAAPRSRVPAGVPPSPSRGRTLRRLGATVVGVTVVVAVVVGVVGVAGYRGDWTRRYEVSGLLADIAATPDRLAALDARDANAAAKIRAVLQLQDALTAPAAETDAAETAYRVLFVSDVHRRNVYPYLAQYIAANDVAFVVNTGDETLVGQPAELTSDYVAAIAAITRETPMLWIKGNHDSAAVAARMAAIPGVTVLDREVVDAFGLQVYGVADPRTYGAKGDAGSDDPDTVTRVETAAASGALADLDRSTFLDLLLAHEPVMADAMAGSLGPAVRATASGHVHRQNPEDALQTDGRIDLVEGTTGLGGLLRVGGEDPMSFSILSVAPDCQFTRVVRYQLADPSLGTDDAAAAFGENSSFQVHYFDRQDVSTDRTCSRSAGLGTPQRASNPDGLGPVSRFGPPDAQVPTGTAVSTPAPVSSDDETGDAEVNSSPGATVTSSPTAGTSPTG